MTTPWETLCRYRAHDGTVASVLETRSEGDAARPLLIFGNTTWSWGELSLQVDAGAHHLASRGIRKADRVAVVAENSDAYVIAFLALARLGAILVPINPNFSANEASYVL